MKKACGQFLFEQSIALFTGILLGVSFTAGMSYESSKDLWQTVGSLCAGFGTVAILIFGWLKANEWIHVKRVDLATNALLEINDLRFKSNRLLTKIIDAEKKVALSSESAHRDLVVEQLNQLRGNLDLLCGIKCLDKELSVQNFELHRACTKLVETVSDLEAHKSTVKNWVTLASKARTQYLEMYGGGVYGKSFFEKCIAKLPY